MNTRDTIGKKRIAAYATARPPSFPQDVRIRRNTYVRRNRIRICSRRRWARRCVTGHYCRQRLPRSRRVSSGAAGGGQFAIQFKEDSSGVAPSLSLPPPVSSTRPSRFPLTGVRARARFIFRACNGETFALTTPHPLELCTARTPSTACFFFPSPLPST